jgi:hypothetical protein
MSEEIDTCLEWDCEGCGTHVFAFGRTAIPKHLFCATCEHLCAFVANPEEIERIRRRLGEFDATRPSPTSHRAGAGR